MTWEQIAIDAQANSAHALSTIADLQDKHLRFWQDQAEKDERFAKRLQALEEVRHQENRRDAATFSKREIGALWGTTVLTAVISIVAAVIAILK